jgi:plastocyanin
MRRIAVVAVMWSVLPFAGFAKQSEEHLEHLRAMMAAMSTHGPIIPQPESIRTEAVVTINVTARSFSFNPATFTVNQGDVVTINCTVPGNDPSKVGHGILMDTYITDGLDVPTGKTESRTFTATTAGNFAFVCTQPSCGDGHSSMIGQMIVKAVSNPAPSISSVFPTSGSTAGGTTVTISGANFQTSGTTTAKFDNTATTNVNVTSSTSMTAVTPAHTAGPVSVTVTNPDGQSATLSNAFTYSTPLPAPTISLIAPNSGPIAGGTSVVILGSGFAAAATVTLGGVPATNVKVLNDSTITATTPAHGAGAVDLVVAVGSQSATKSGAFNYLSTPPPRHRAARH